MATTDTYHIRENKMTVSQVLHPTQCDISHGQNISTSHYGVL